MQIAMGLLLAVSLGLAFPSLSNYTSWMGTIFLRALKMIVAPLVLTSIISGIGRLGGGKDVGRLGLKTFLYYAVTGLIAILTGLTLVNLIHPGIGANLGFTQPVNELAATSGSFSDNILRIIPENIFKALAETDMLAIVFISMLFGFFITKLNQEHKATMNKFFDAANELVMIVTGLIIRFSPFGVFGIVIKIVAEQKNLPELIYSLGLYMVVVIAGLMIHSMFTMPLLLKFFAKINPLKHARAMVTPLLTAFSTSSSNATLPLTMTALEKNAGVSNKICSFTLPIGATINTDGTALYEIVAVLFIAQAYGIDLSIGEQLLSVLLALLTAFGVAGIPMASMVSMGIILSAVGLPLEGIGLILAVDRILDMCRTTVNVWGDTCICVFVARSEGEKIYAESRQSEV
jgi:Na+/H+-dicarboxylate symporter